MPLDDALRRFLDGWEEVQVGKDGALSLPPSAEQDLSPSADPKTAEMVAEMLARVLRERCIGCGICEYKCPVNGEAAIRVFVPEAGVPF